MKIFVISKKLIFIFLLIIIVVGVPTSIFGYNNYNFNKFYNRGIDLLNNEDFDGATSVFIDSLTYKPNKKKLVDNKISLAKSLKESKEIYDLAVTLESEKKYLESIDAFQKVKNTDVKRYKEAQNFIEKCSDSYIKESIDTAMNEATSKNFEKAITYLDNILKFDASNEEAQTLKDEYNNEIQKIAAAAKKAEENKIVAEKANLTTQKTVNTTDNTATSNENNEVLSNKNLQIKLSGGTDPNFGRLMGLSYARIDQQPFCIVFRVIQGGIGHDINYDITFYLHGRTAKYSGKTSSELSRLSVSSSEVPKGENIKIVINFLLDGKKYTTTGYRVISNR